MDADPSPTVADETPTLPAVILERHASNGDDEVTCILHCGDEAYVIDMTEDAYSALAAALDPAAAAKIAALRSRLTEVERQRDAAYNLADGVGEQFAAAIATIADMAAERDRMLPVVEAAKTLAAHRHTNADPADATDALFAAVDLYSSTVHPPTPETPNGH